MNRHIILGFCAVALTISGVSVRAQSTDAAPLAAATATAEVKVEDGSAYNFSDTEIGPTLTSLARKAGVSLIVGDGVTGKVTVHLENVSPKDAMRLIAESKGLVMQEDKGIVKIRTKEAADNQPLEIRVYTFKYAKADDIKKVIDEIKGPKGKIQVDTRSNALVLSDTPNELEKMMPVLTLLDTQTPQVMIETKFIETTRNPQKDVGINWGGTLLNHKVTAGQPNTTYAPPTTSTTIPFTKNLSFWNTSAMLDIGQASAALSFLNQDNDSELLANPRVVTTDNGKAKINISKQFPIPSFTFSEQTASLQINGFQYKDIGITLVVTPRINKDNFITLEIAPEVSTSTENVNFSSGGTAGSGAGASFLIPIIETRQASSTVMIKSGNTLAMGGLIREDISDSYTKVPVMGDIPGLGALFRSKSLNRKKKNLLVFLTPTIVNPEAQNATGMEKFSNGFLEEEIYTKDKWMPKDNAKPRQLMKWPSAPKSPTSTPDKLTPGNAPSQNFAPAPRTSP